MSRADEIKELLKGQSGVFPDRPDTDIFKDMGIVGDDFHEVIEKYSKKFDVDMTDYLWYFHTDEEGHGGLGQLFFKPPYGKVKRIPVTPKMLTDFTETKKWQIDYPEHDRPKSRPDLLINTTVLISLFIGLLVWLTYKYFI